MWQEEIQSLEKIIDNKPPHAVPGCYFPVYPVPRLAVGILDPQWVAADAIGVCVVTTTAVP